MPPDFFNHCPERNFSAQMLLLCAWRSSKEISLLIGDFCTYESNSSSHVKISFTNEELIKMSEFFSNVLEKIKHRGAFEQVSLQIKTVQTIHFITFQ